MTLYNRKKAKNYYKRLHDATLSILLGISLSSAIVPMVYNWANRELCYAVSKTFWVAGSTIILTVMFCYSDEEKEVLK